MSAKGLLGAVLIVAAASLAGGGFYVMHGLKQKRFDPETLCPLEGSKSVTLIVIDKTDPLTGPEQTHVRHLVAAERDAVIPGDRIAIKLLAQQDRAKEAVLDTVADLCNPGSDANPLFENPRRVEARYRNAFKEPIEAALAGMADAGSAPSSPIANAIRVSIEDSTVSGGQRTDQGVKLILISDLMEHTSLASAYGGTLSEAALGRLIPIGAQARLRNAAIRVLLLPRPRYAKQQQAAVAIWRRFLEAVSGHPVTIERI